MRRKRRTLIFWSRLLLKEVWSGSDDFEGCGLGRKGGKKVRQMSEE